jgi:hypothetical protein
MFQDGQANDGVEVVALKIRKRRIENIQASRVHMVSCLFRFVGGDQPEALAKRLCASSFARLRDPTFAEGRQISLMLPVHVLGILHALILIWLTWRSTGHLSAERLQRVSAAYLLIWCNLVYTGLLLSVISRLNVVGFYFSVSVGLAAGLEILLQVRRVLPQTGAAAEAALQDRRFDRAIRYALRSVLALVALATALICVHYAPNNWDTCTYRLSRVFFYLARGNLLHAGNPGDPRLSFYPFNGALTYLFLAVYCASAKWFNLISAMTWVLAGVATYCTARRLGASKTGSLVATWVCLLSPSVLAQAASGNDEVLTATPVLIGVSFAIDWARTGRKCDAILAAIGLGLGLGTKFHPIFYWVFLLLGALLLGRRLIRLPNLRSQVVSRIPGMLAAAVIAIPLAVAFIVCNYISSGHITDSAYNNPIRNTPFRLSLAREKIITTSSELLLSPIPDLVPPIHPETRQPVYAAFNASFMRLFSPFLPLTTKVSPEGYVFRGPSDALAYMPAENTVWLGFLPHFLILVGIVQVLTRRLPFGCVVLVVAFFCWILTFTTEVKYSFWSCTYSSFAAVLVAAAVGPVWDFARSYRAPAGRVLLAGFLALFGTHALLSANLLTFGRLRNISFLLQKGPTPPEVHAVDAPVADAIRSARRVYLPYTHWEVLYWNFMRFNPAAKYTTGMELRLPSAGTLMLLSIQGDLAAGTLAVRLPSDAPPALTYIGEADYEHVFAQGDRIETRYPERSRYALVQVTWRRNAPQGRIVGVQAVSCCVGLEPSDGVAVRYGLLSRATGKSVEVRWLLPGEPQNEPFREHDEPCDDFWIESRRVAHPEQVTRTVYDLKQPAYVVGKGEADRDGAAGPVL